MMLLFNKHIVTFILPGIVWLFSGTISFAQQTPVFIFPDWDIIQPGFAVDTVPCPLKPETASREKIKTLVKLREMPLPKSKNKKQQPDTMAVWKFDSEGRVVSYRTFENGWPEQTITYAQGGKISSVKTLELGKSHKQIFISYNRSGLPALIIVSDSQETGSKNPVTTADTISLLYNATGQLVVKNRKTRDENGNLFSTSETFSYDAFGNSERHMTHNKNGELQSTDSMVIYRNKGVFEITHYHTDPVNFPGAAYGIDQITLDSSSRNVLLYAYNLPTGNGNMKRVVNPGERRTYHYEKGKLHWAAFMQTGKEPFEETFYRYDEKGRLQTEFFKRKLNGGAKKGTQLYDAYSVQCTYDPRGILMTQEKRFYNNTRINTVNDFPEAGGKEDGKAYERYRFVAR